MASGLFMLSILISGVAFSYAKEINAKRNSALGYLDVVGFGLGVFLSFWTTSVYVLWKANVFLDVPLVINGGIASHWWLPLVSILFALLSWANLNRKS